MFLSKKSTIIKKLGVPLIATTLIATNMFLPTKKSHHKPEPQAIIAAVAGGSIAAGASVGLVSGITVDAAEFALAFEAAAAGASMGEVLAIVGGILGVAAGIGVILAVAA